MKNEEIAREIVEKVNRCLPPDDLETAFPLLIIVQRDIAAVSPDRIRALLDEVARLREPVEGFPDDWNSLSPSVQKAMANFWFRSDTARMRQVTELEAELARLRKERDEALEKVATTADDAMRNARNRDMWQAQSKRQAETLTELRESLVAIRRRAIFGPGISIGDLLDMTALVAPAGDELGVDRDRDATNPFAPRPRPVRLMTDAERRAAGLDPNGGFDGPTGAD